MDTRLVLIVAALVAATLTDIRSASAQEAAPLVSAGEPRDQPVSAQGPVAVEDPIQWPEWSHAARLVHARFFTQVRGRQFDYNDVITRNLREFRSGASAAFGGAVEFYPFSFGDPGRSIRRIGLEGMFSADIGQSPVIADVPDAELSLQWLDWRVGPAVRFDFRHILFKLSASAGVYSSVFAAPDGSSVVGSAVLEVLPSVEYINVRLALGARYELELISIEAELAYMLITRAGAVTRLFPSAAVGGAEARLLVSRRLWWGFEVYGAFDYDHFYWSMRPRPGDLYLAGGALDLHFGFELGLSWTY